AWTVPDVVSGTLRAKVSQTTDAEAFDASDGDFRIRVSVTLGAPNGGEQWRVGTSQNITWVKVGTIPNVRLEYSRDGFAADIQTINALASSTSPFGWTIPDAISNTVRVRISDSNDAGAVDTSNADFRITANFTLASPNGSEQWLVGSAYPITWTSAGSVTNVKLEYSINSGGSWLALLGSTPNDGTQNWTIPDNISATARVRVSDPADVTAEDSSDNDFKIRSNFVLTAPNGGEVWTVGESRSITWTFTGTVPNVKLTYSTNGGGAYSNTIIASTANSSPYAWTVPDAISTQLRVKVESTTDVDATDASDANFKVRGAFALTAPNGAEGWPIAQSRNITWTTTGTIANVKLTYSTNSGSTFPNSISASVANTNTYAWTLPDVPTTTARVRVEDVNDSTVYDDSNANFSIQGNFVLTAPNGGEVWTVAESRNISWTWGGTIPNVKLTYSINSGGAYPNSVVASAPNGSGSSGTFNYAWTIPDSIATTARVKIEDAGDPAVFDTSDADFKIQGKLLLTSPNGGERWVTNESHPITWTRTGSIGAVKIEYSTDGGVTWPVGNLIVATTPANNLSATTGSYAWTIPNVATPPLSTVKVRVLNADDLTVLDESNANFTFDYYTITWKLLDLLSNNHISNLTVNSTDGWVGSGLTSPVVRKHAYGSFTATWTETAYGEKAQPFVANADQTITIFMETKVVHVWEPKTTIVFNPTSTTLSLGSILTRDGINVTGATSCEIKIYDGTTLLTTLSSGAVAPDANTGQYSFTYVYAFDAAKVYVAVTKIGIATGGYFSQSKSFSVTAEQKLQDVQNIVTQKLDTSLSAVNTNLQTTLAAQTTTINTKLDEQKTIITTKMDQGVAKIDGAVTTLKTESGKILVSMDAASSKSSQAADQLQASAKESEATAKRFAARIIASENPLAGSEQTIQFSSQSDAVPVIDIINEAGNKFVTSVPMIPDPKNPGFFYYKTTFEPSRFPPGQYTTIIQDAVYGSYVAQGFNIETATISDVMGMVAGQSGAKDYAKQSLEIMKAVKGDLATGGDVHFALESLKHQVQELPKLLAAQQEKSKVGKAVNEITAQLKDLIGDELGIDLGSLMAKQISENPTVQEIRKSADQIQGAVEVTQGLMEKQYGGEDAPVVQTSIY
ncbi:MAG: hypothetical protein HY594_05370, partial [Candidatus Omnitrophica bacterium]|nr:hypothetical protein [Candidatus Omnitrophota bacterium]